MTVLISRECAYFCFTPIKPQPGPELNLTAGNINWETRNINWETRNIDWETRNIDWETGNIDWETRKIRFERGGEVIKTDRVKTGGNLIWTRENQIGQVKICIGWKGGD